jgi:ribosomal protein S8
VKRKREGRKTLATLKDVAKETGLTVTTISRVLNNRGYISKIERYTADKKRNHLTIMINLGCIICIQASK